MNSAFEVVVVRVLGLGLSVSKAFKEAASKIVLMGVKNGMWKKPQVL